MMEQRSILSVDFREQEKRQQRKANQSLAAAYYKVFSTPEGAMVLQDLKRITGGRLCVGSSHEMAAAAGKRDLLDEIEENINHGFERLSS